MLREQRGVCPLTGKPVDSKSGDPHHAFYKRSANVPEVVLHSPQNLVILNPSAHLADGQTKEVTRLLLIHKLTLGYDIFGWVDRVIEAKLMVNRPDIYGFGIESKGSGV